MLQVGVTTPGAIDAPSDPLEARGIAAKQAAKLGREALGNATKVHCVIDRRSDTLLTP